MGIQAGCAASEREAGAGIEAQFAPISDLRLCLQLRVRYVCATCALLPAAVLPVAHLLSSVRVCVRVLLGWSRRVQCTQPKPYTT
jgi:hypothetical protein